jgi:hypothetical protein
VVAWSRRSHRVPDLSQLWSTSPEASPALFPATPERADLHRQSPIPIPVPMEYLWSLHALVAAMARGEVPSSFPPLYAEGVAVASVDLTSIKARALHASSSRARSNASSRHTTMPGFRSTISVFHPDGSPAGALTEAEDEHSRCECIG